jgi:hypothetical protein
MVMSFFIAPFESLLLKVDFVTTPKHDYSRLINPFAPRCPIESTTHRFLRLAVRAS